MASVVIRNLPEETHRAIKLRAATNGRSTEAEIREMLEIAVRPPGRFKLGSALAALGREYGGVDLQIERDKTVSEPISFE